MVGSFAGCCARAASDHAAAAPPCPASHPVPSRSAFAPQVRTRARTSGLAPVQSGINLPQSSSASRRTASHAGFLLLSQSGERPLR
jgi:hypothetical protein